MTWSVANYNTTPSANSAINGTIIAEGCNASGVNDAIRQMMADIATMVAGGGLEPSGAIKAFAGASAPTGYLLCDGSAVSRTTYAALFDVANTTWGVGDGSTTFNLPDYRGKVIVGAGTGSGLTARALAAVGGEETHVLSAAETAALTVALSGTTAAGSAHNHGITDPGHAHTVPEAYSGSGTAGAVSGATGGGTNNPTSTATTGISMQNESAHTHAFSASGSTNGGGGAHNNMQPFAVANVIIKT